MVPERARRLGRVLLVCALALGACRPELADRIPTISDDTRTIISSDGAFSMKIPESWSRDTRLNDVAVLQAADREREAYAVLISQPRAPFADRSLEQFAEEQVQVFLQSVADAQTEGPSQVQIDGKDSLQYQISGKVDGVDVVYLYTFLESADQFMKVLAWSLAGRFESNRDALERVTNSTRQVRELGNLQPAGEQPPDQEVVPETEGSPPAAEGAGSAIDRG